jgi:hypothetical protein
VDLSDYVYHYTGATALAGIVLEQEFWATDSAYLNDRFESELVDKTLHSIIANPEIYLGARPKPTEVVREALRHHLRQGRHSSIVSFSTHGNSLTQFRMYSPPAGGYVLGFPRSYIQRLGELVVCDYSPDNLLNWCIGFIERFSEAAAPLAETVGAAAISTYLNMTTTLLKERIDAGLRFKSDDFRNEGEVRLVIHGGAKNIRATASDSLLLPYQIVPMPNEAISVLVCAGPNADPGLAERAIAHLGWLTNNSGNKWSVCSVGTNHAYRVRTQ